MTRYMAMLLLLAITSSVQAQQVFKCVNGKQVAYQSHPCGTKVDVADFKPPPAADVQRIQKMIEDTNRRDADLRANRTGGYSTAQGTVIPIQGGSACEDAKLRRKRQLEIAGSRVSIEYRRALDKDVQAACKF